MTQLTLPSFDQPHLARAIESLRPEEIDALPFGTIRLDEAGRVVFYSKAEGRLSGRGDRPVLGYDFFKDIAPCMDADHYKGRLDRALKARTVDIEFTHIGDFEDRDRELRVRIQSASDGGCWIFHSRD